MANAPAPVVTLERCKDDRLLVRPGRNVWLLVRTDRDAASKDEAVQSAGAFLSRVLGRASPQGWDQTQFLQAPEPPGDALAEFYMGAARPVLVLSAGQQWPGMEWHEGGTRLGRSIECKGTRLVKADRPWYLVVAFDWRGPDTWIPWPASFVNFIGVRASDTRRTDLDWLVNEAYYEGEAQAPDSSLGAEIVDFGEKKLQELGNEAKQLAEATGKRLLIVAAVAAVLLVAYGYAKRGGSKE